MDKEEFYKEYTITREVDNKVIFKGDVRKVGKVVDEALREYIKAFDLYKTFNNSNSYIVYKNKLDNLFYTLYMFEYLSNINKEVKHIIRYTKNIYYEKEGIVDINTNVDWSTLKF